MYQTKCTLSICRLKIALLFASESRTGTIITQIESRPTGGSGWSLTANTREDTGLNTGQPKGSEPRGNVPWQGVLTR